MAEQKTMTENVFVREVCQDMLNETLDSMLKLIKYIKVDKTLNGRPGNTVKVTKWGYIGAAKDTAEGEVIWQSLSSPIILSPMIHPPKITRS